MAAEVWTARRAHRLLVLGAAAAVLVGACGRGAPTASRPAVPQATSEADIALGGPVTVTIWHGESGTAAKAFDDLVAEFDRTNGNGITVKAEDRSGGTSYTGLYRSMLGAIQAGAMPDMIVGVADQIADYAKAGVIVDLTPYIASATNGLSTDSLADVYTPYLDADRYPQYGNEILSFPFSESLDVLYRNDDLATELGFSAAPTTWNDLEREARAAMRRDAAGRVTRWGMSAYTVDTFLGSVVDRGGAVVTPDLSGAAFGGAQGLASLQLLERGVDEGWVYVPKGYDWEDRFAEGDLLFAGNASTFIPFLADAARTKPLHWSVIPWPRGGGRAAGMQVGGVVAVTNTTPERQLASWEFIKWLTDTKQTARWAALSGYMPVRASAANEHVLTDHWAEQPQSKEAFGLVARSAAAPSIRGYQEIRDAVSAMLAKITARKATAENALKDAVVAVDGILRENK